MSMEGIKNKLAKVDKRVWVALGCMILYIAIFSFLTSTIIGKWVIYVLGTIIIDSVLIGALYKLYVFILKKIKFNKIPTDFEFKVSIKKIPGTKVEKKPEVTIEVNSPETEVVPEENVVMDNAEKYEPSEAEEVIPFEQEDTPQN